MIKIALAVANDENSNSSDKWKKITAVVNDQNSNINQRWCK